MKCAAWLLVVAACSPMYGSRAEHLAPAPTRVPPPIVEPAIPYIEACATSFREDPKKFHVDHAVGEKLVANADTEIARHPREVEARVQVVNSAIETYSNALRRDPYNADATLKLALAYHELYRKGCALQLLKRIAILDTNPTVSPDAKATIGRVVGDGRSFAPYHQEAVHALGE